MEPDHEEEDLETVDGKISSFSGGQGNCVEVLARRAGIVVRHSAHRAGPTVTFTPDEWDAFREGVKAGEFDPK